MNMPLAIDALQAMSPEERTLKLFSTRRYSELLLYRMLKGGHIRYIAQPDPHGGFFPRESFEPTGIVPEDAHQRWLYEHLPEHRYNYRRVLDTFEHSQLPHIEAPLTYAETVGTGHEQPLSKTMLAVVGSIGLGLTILMYMLGSLFGACFIILVASVVVLGYRYAAQQSQLGGLYDQAFATVDGLSEEDAVIVGGLGIYLAPLLIQQIRGNMEGTVYLYQQPWYGAVIVNGGVEYFDRPGVTKVGSQAQPIRLK